MALALVAESVVSVVIKKLISKGISYAEERIAGPSAVKDEIESLRRAFPQIKAILTFVEQGQTADTTKQNEGLDAWLWQLRDAVDQAEDVVDEMEYYELEKEVQAGDNKVQQGFARNLKRKCADFVNNILQRLCADHFVNNILGDDDTLKRLREAVKALDNVAATSPTLVPLVLQPYDQTVKSQREDKIRNARETSSFLTEDTIFGRDTEKERIVESLTKPTSAEPENASAAVRKVSAFTIVGMGGLGKTTLAQFIYHDEKVREFFDLVMWVCVSDQFDATMLTRKILEAAKVDEKDLRDKRLDTIQEILKKNLISKKFLLVLDDVWNDDNILEWNKLVAPLKFGKKGSKILLTTRMDLVAKRVANVLKCKEEFLKLSGLEKVDFMHLFNTHAFAGVNIDHHVNLKLIGEKIAEKLGGCPLAAKILGGYLNTCMDEKYWRRILNENSLNLQESKDNIMMILRLSYDHLPTSLQICFRYCSIFPKDYEFEKNELIHLWIGSGLIKQPTHEKRSLEDIGEEYLNHLAKKSLFDIKISEDDYDSEQHYVMHDLLHDLAQLVSSGECLGIDGDGSGDIPKTIRHIYVNKVNPHKISHLKNLRTLIIHLNKNFTAVDFIEVLKELKSLRFLQAPACGSEFLDEVGKLIHLRHLSLSPYFFRTHEIPVLPQSVCRLYHLEVMKLWGETTIDDSTRDRMNNLVKLKRLPHFPNKKIMDEIPWIGKMTSLQELGNFHVREECGYKIDQLKNLQNLRKLGIRGLENVTSPEEAANANLIEKENLDELSLRWSTDRSGGPGVDEPLLDNLEPHTNLKELEMEGYAGVRSPHWMTATSLSNVTHISLDNCSRWEDLPTLGQLPLLKSLNLDDMPAVKKLWCSTSVGGCAFPSLQVLELKSMPNLELFGGEHMFPLLNVLNITSCPSLKGLPALPLTLNRLEIQEAGLTSLPMMQQDCGSSGEGRASSSSSLHPALSHLSICKCPNLTSLDGFMSQQQYFPVLTSLFIEECENLRHLPEKFFQTLPLLEHLTIEMCPNLTTLGLLDNRLPETLVRQESLPKLTSLPPGEFYPRLSKLRIRNCKELSSLDGLQDRPSLIELHIKECDKLIKLSLGVTSTSHTDMVLRPPMEKLRDLEIRNCKELSTLDGLQDLPSLKLLCIEGCGMLIKLSLGVTSTSPTDMVLLRPPMEQLRYLKELSSLDRLQALPSLEYLSIDGCDKLIEISLGITSTSHTDMVLRPPMEKLRHLQILNCKELSSLDGLQALPSLEHLSIDGCDKLIELSLGVTSTSHTDMVLLRPPMEQLRYLYIWNCKELSTLDGLQALPSLIELGIGGCDKLIKLGVTSHTDMVLSALHIDRHAWLRLEPLRSLSSVSKLTIYDGTGESTSLDEQWLLQNRNSLQRLAIYKASSLESLPTSMIDLQALRHLTIDDAPLLETIPELPTSMESLTIRGCRPELKEYIEGSGKFDNIPHVEITGSYEPSSPSDEELDEELDEEVDQIYNQVELIAEQEI